MLIEGTVYDLKRRVNNKLEVPIWNLKLRGAEEDEDYNENTLVYY